MNILNPTWDILTRDSASGAHSWCNSRHSRFVMAGPTAPAHHASTSSHKRKSLRPSGSWGVACTRWTEGAGYVMVSGMTTPENAWRPVLCLSKAPLYILQHPNVEDSEAPWPNFGSLTLRISDDLAGPSSHARPRRASWHVLPVTRKPRSPSA